MGVAGESVGDDGEEEVEDVGESGRDAVAWDVPSNLRSVAFAVLVSAKVLLSTSWLVWSPGFNSGCTVPSSPGSSTDTLLSMPSGPDCWW